jgi:hypothetical protein
LAKRVIGARSLVHRRGGEESEVALKVAVRHCSRRCSRGESTRESNVVIGLMHEWKESDKRDDDRV